MSKAEFRSWGSYLRFQHVVRSELRYVRSADTEEFLQTVLATALNRVEKIKTGTLLWRVQLGNDYREVLSPDLVVRVPCPYPAARMKPLDDQAPEGRANSKGILYLYLATERDTAMSEVRLSLESSISIAQFTVKRDLTIIDCSLNGADQPLWLARGPNPAPDVRERAVRIDIDRAFAEPVGRRNDVADYVPTQILSEIFKHNGCDGVKYRSAFSNTGHNLALFDTTAADLLSCALFYPTKIAIEFQESAKGYVV